MSSFFTVPGSQRKRKRPTAPEAPKKRAAASKASTNGGGGGAAAGGGGAKKKSVAVKKRAAERDESISGSESESEESFQGLSNREDDVNKNNLGSDEEEEDEEEGETAAEKRLRLAERYLENVKETVDDFGFDAAEIDRDLIAERLQEDIAETKGKVYRQLASELAFDKASKTFFRTNTSAVTSITACAPYVYTATKDLCLHKWRIQDLPQHQYPQTTKRKPKKPPAPPKKRPELETWIKGNKSKANDNTYRRHVGRILAVAASGDGKYVVTGGEDHKIIVHDAATLKPIKVLMHHRAAVTGLAFRRGTNQLYSCSKDRTVKVWSLDEMAYIETLFGHQDEILDIDALAQERCVSVGARDRTARLWKVAEETQLVFRGGAVDKKSHPGVNPRSLLHEGSMDRIAMIDDELFITGSDNGSLALWSVTKKKPVYVEPLAHGLDPPLKLSDVSAEVNPRPEAIPAPLPRWITALRTIPYSDIILSGSWDGHIRVWRLSEDKKKIELVTTLGASNPSSSSSSSSSSSTATSSSASSDNKSAKSSKKSTKSGDTQPISGVINGITVFERGERGKEGLCIVAAVATEHRLGRWTATKKGTKNGGVVFEIPRIQHSTTTTSTTTTTNGGTRKIEDSSDEDA